MEPLTSENTNLKKKRGKFGIPRAALRDWRFWAALGAVLGLAVLHDFFELAGAASILGNFYFLPISLFWAPVIYVAFVFGLACASATALLAIAVSIPNFIFWHQGPDRFLEMSYVVIMAMVTVLVGYIVEQKKEAREAAKLASFRTLRAHEEERQRISRL